MTQKRFWHVLQVHCFNNNYKKSREIWHDPIIVICLVSFLPDCIGHVAHTETTGRLFLVRGRWALYVCPLLRNKLERFIRAICLAIGLHGVWVLHASSCNFSWILNLPDPSGPLLLLREASSPLSGHSSVHYTSEAGTLKRSAYQWTFAQCCI